MLDPPGAYTSERARAMITIQAASESTTIEKIAARNEKRSVRRLNARTGRQSTRCGRRITGQGDCRSGSGRYNHHRGRVNGEIIPISGNLWT